MNVSNSGRGGGHMSARVNHLSELKTSGSSFQSGFGDSSGMLNRPLVKGKYKKADEGVEGLPVDAKPVKESDYEEADSCFSCSKTLSKSFGALMKKGRHHCRRCGRTTCDRCWRNEKRLS